MASIDLNLLLDAHRLAMSDLDQRSAQVDRQEDKARRLIEDCAAQRQEIERDRATLLAAEQIYRRRFIPDDEAPLRFASAAGRPPAEVDGDQRPKTRARVGPQRYRMLTFLRHRLAQPASPVEISAATGLTQTRVRKQMRSDVADGFVEEIDDLFHINPSGLALLDRFEAYKRSKGEPLPPLDGPISDDEDETDDREPEELAAA
jgi:hypothetical protein